MYWHDLLLIMFIAVFSAKQ